MSVIVMFPTTPRPEPSDMNYTVVVLGAVLLLALAYYFCPKYGGHVWFRGPIRDVDTVVKGLVEEKSAVENSADAVLEHSDSCDTETKSES